MSTLVPNLFPVLDSPYKIALIGEAPGEDEVKKGEPFIGMSGRFLAALLSRAGVQREACFLGNVCQHHPEHNEIAAYEWLGDEIQSGLVELKKDLEAFKPNIIVCLGGAPLHYFKTGPSFAPRKRKLKGRLVFNWPHKPTVWRGSLFSSTLNQTKALATLHPAYVLRDYEMCPLLQFDLKRAVREAVTPVLKLPERHFILDKDKVFEQLNYLKWSKSPVAIDIEGGINSMSCISFAISKNSAFIIPFFDKQLNRYYDLKTECQIFRALAEVLEDPEIPKTLQNSLYDRFVLQYCYKIRVSNVQNDTMLKSWELYSELPKGLDTQMSIYTDEPYYKGDRKTQDDKTFFEYCCKDSAVTYEINDCLTPRIHGTSLGHYRLNMALLHPLLYMEHRGIRYDIAGAASRRADIRRQMFETQARLNGMVGRFIKTKSGIWDFARSRAYVKATIPKHDYVALATNAKKDAVDDLCKLVKLVHEPNPTLATIGEIEDLIELSLNVGSNKQMVSFLYDTLGLPMQYNTKKQYGEEDTRSPTGDYEALLTLCKHCIDKKEIEKVKILSYCIEIRSLATRERMLSIRADEDGRIRCGYNVVGSETGRTQSYESPTGSGYALSTIPKYDRDLFLANEDHWMAELDLEGADSWTVAAYCAMLGDRTMLDDLLAGLRPPKILVLQLEGKNVNFNDREALKVETNKVDKNSWVYFAMKRVNHGCCYVEGPKRVSNQIFTDSEGKFYLSEADCKKLRDHFLFKRYPGIQKVHRWMDTNIRERPTIIAASGQIRHFFGRKDELLPKAMAHEPQANTTYATNLALYRLWTDPENRTNNSNSSPGLSMRDIRTLPSMRHDVFLRIEPLHQVHDALVVQFKKCDTTWAIGKIKSYFDNTLNIAGQRIKIPFEGAYGESWGNLKQGKI